MDKLFDQYVVIPSMLNRLKHSLSLMIMLHLAIFDISQSLMTPETFIDNLAKIFFLIISICWWRSFSFGYRKHFLELFLCLSLEFISSCFFSVYFFIFVLLLLLKSSKRRRESLNTGSFLYPFQLYFIKFNLIKVGLIFFY